MIRLAAEGRRQCRVLILVPNIARDLEGHALVAYHIRKRYAHDVRLCNLADLHETLLSYAPDVLVVDRIDSPSRLAPLARRLGMQVVLLPTLGFMQEAIDTEARRAGKYERGEETLDGCFTWGEAGRRLLLAQTSLTESQLCTVGSPRFDFYSEPYLSLVEPRESFLRRCGIPERGAPLVVWATNTYHTETRDLEATVRDRVAGGATEAIARAELEDEGTAFRDLSSVVTTLADAHPEWDFLIKLHPSEMPEPYRALAERAANIHLVTDGRIRDVLYHSSALLTNCSTTSTEAWMLGKPMIEVMLGEYTIPLPDGYLEGSDAGNAIDVVERLLEGYLGDPAAPIPEAQRGVRDAYLADLYFRIDGKSSERCAEQIDRLLSSTRHSAERQEAISLAAAAEHARWSTARDRRPSNRLKRALGLPPETSLRFWQRRFWSALRSRGERMAWEREITPEMVGDLHALFDVACARDTREQAAAARLVTR